MKKRIFVTRRIPDIGITMLKDKGYEIVQGTFKTPPTKAQLLSVIQKAKKENRPFDAILTLLTDPVDAAFIKAAAPSVKIISNYAVGYNNIAVAEANKAGIVVTNTPGGFSDCIAEHTVALIFALTTRLVEADQYVRRGKYKGWDPMIFIGTDLSKKTIGILGAGHIGERVAMHLGKGFDMKVMYYDVRRNESLEKKYGAIFCENPEDIYKEADIISLHVPLLPSTKHMINDKAFGMMKKTAIVVNTARGPVIEEKALVKALKKGTIAGAGLDVFEFEPKVSKELVKMSNVVLTPHIASARESARNEMAILAASNIIDVFEGKTPKGLVQL